MAPDPLGPPDPEESPGSAETPLSRETPLPSEPSLSRQLEADSLGDLVLAIDHVGIAVPDLDTAVAFYTATFGLVERHRENNAEQGVAEAMLAPASGADTDTRLQLLAPLTSESTIARFIDRSGPGLQQLAYRVENIDQASRVLRGKGVRLLYDAAKHGTNDSMINFVHPKDTGGVLIELVQAARSAGTG